MEADPGFKQVIPYLVLRDDERYFLMRRTRAGGDVRLHDRWSIGVGGHLNPGDENIDGGLRREWSEELIADFVPEFRFVGLLNDDTTAVGQVHLKVQVAASGLEGSPGGGLGHRGSAKVGVQHDAGGVNDATQQRLSLAGEPLSDELSDVRDSRHGLALAGPIANGREFNARGFDELIVRVLPLHLRECGGFQHGRHRGYIS